MAWLRRPRHRRRRPSHPTRPGRPACRFISRRRWSFTKRSFAATCRRRGSPPRGWPLPSRLAPCRKDGRLTSRSCTKRRDGQRQRRASSGCAGDRRRAQDLRRFPPRPRYKAVRHAGDRARERGRWCGRAHAGAPAGGESDAAGTGRAVQLPRGAPAPTASARHRCARTRCRGTIRSSPPSLLARPRSRSMSCPPRQARVKTPGARAVFYGQMIARCASCHAVHRKVWGPSRR